jgi:5-methylcytosine-specific restriction endonuclease McrA
MWDAPERGVLTGDSIELARLIGCDLEMFNRNLCEIERLKIGDVERNGNTITIINRRMVQEELRRTSNKRRQRKLREKGGGDPARWAAIRVPILERDEYMCAYCGRKADTVDHIIPKSKGGTEDPSNLVACCKRCNNRKQSRTPEQAEMSFWRGFDKTKLQYNSDITPPSSSSTSSSKNRLSSNEDNQPPAGHFEKKIQDPKTLSAIIEVCQKLEGKISQFNPYQMVQKFVGKHPMAILTVLTALQRYVDNEIPFKKGPWPVANTVMKKEEQNYAERESVEAHKHLMADMKVWADEVKQMSMNIGKRI